jgi:hypothetical protein
MELRPRLVTRSLFVFALLAGGIAAADDGPSSDPVGPGTAPSADASEPAAPAPVIEDKRVFGVLPNYRTTEETAIYVPITSRQKLTIATKDTIDYPLFLLGAGLGGIAQLADEHPLFGQGLKGYAHRYWTSYADQAIGNYMTEGILPILFHEDPRYFRRGHGPKLGRTAYAATRIFVTRTDSGGTTFNFAEVVGNSIAAAAGNAYYPGETHLWDNVSRLGQDLATDAISQILKEFWPDIKRRYFVRHKDSSSLLPAVSKTTGRSGS